MNKDLLNRIEEGIPGFSKGQKLIARYMIEHYEEAAYMTAARLGKLVGVSESTVVRFACELGFEGYPELQRGLQELIRTRLTSFQRMEVANRRMGENDVLDKVLLADAEKIKHTLENADRAAFAGAVEKLLHARHIYVMGVRSSAMLAGFVNQNFQIVFDNVKHVQTTSGSEIFEQLLHMGEGDVLFAISFPRYSKRTINAVAYAKEKGADVIALTDSSDAPIAAYADQLLLAQSDMASFVDSLVAPLSIINAIIVAVAMKRQDETDVRLRQLEKIWKEYDVYATGDGGNAHG
ncbi:MAG: MurR/RpiR family transcriptional regulator [Clostridia bacterium]|nr:MurR/RpiR family transcriptional regulator [Clostridia bacterium]